MRKKVDMPRVFFTVGLPTHLLIDQLWPHITTQGLEALVHNAAKRGLQ